METVNRYRIVTQHSYYVLIATNREKTLFKTLVTADIIHELYQLGKEVDSTDQKIRAACSYLVYWEGLNEPKCALEREKEINKLSARRKRELITSVNPEWQFLNDRIRLDGNILLL